MKRALSLFIFIIANGLFIPDSRANQGGAQPNPAKHWIASLSSENEKQYDTALNETRIFQQEGGDTFLANERTGWLKYLKADYAGADQAYGIANKMQPMAVNPLLGLLNIAQALKDLKKVERAADAVLRVVPTNYNALMAMAGVSFAQKDFHKAASQYRRVLTYYPDDVDAMSGAAWADFYLGLKREASDGFRKIMNVNPSYPYAARGLELTAKSAR